VAWVEVQRQLVVLERFLEPARLAVGVAEPVLAIGVLPVAPEMPLVVALT
jgi:hypothetical protein